MLTLMNAAKPVKGMAQRFLAARRSPQAVGTNSSHLGWGIGALVIVGGLLAALHAVWLPWMEGVFTHVTSLSTTTTTTP
uniref:Uncharacterized protein n=1 Tax=Sulfobacillus thermotolerans TaxID=338644 RepID=G5CIZ8_9FIRM|nr:hypothetical protein [Sulfobacillus thermotolerans]AEP14275.1 hypothetical protein [Sulfobacillus thermotolerans]